MTSLLEPGTTTDRAVRLRAEHRARWGADPALVGRAPGRVNLIGEHTDYNGGLVLPVALPHSTLVSLSPRDDGRVRVASLQAEGVFEAQLDDVGPGTVDGWAAYAAGVLWALDEQGVTVPGVDLLVDSTVPLGAGLSSSAALECAVAVAVTALVGGDLSPAGRRRLAAACVRAESEVAGAPTGGMDQAVSLLAEPGAALLLDFDTADGSVGDLRHVELGLERAGLALLVTDTRVSHALVDGGYGDRRAECGRAAEALGVDSLRRADLAGVEALPDPLLRRRARHVVGEVQRVSGVVEAVTAGDWGTVGRAFVASHASMRDDFEISCAELDLAVATAVEAGALGARMTGGGFGGSSVALVPADRVEAVVAAVQRAFADAGHRAPLHLMATPSAAADLV
ncbi:galactokinase [Nocardioides nanhaiensis]|uniref:galactokinase n=1 Tax=Nocardioides nanhaiensis TaxID=1476871 RepID=UPI0031F13C64